MSRRPAVVRDVSRRGVLQGAVALGTLGYGAGADGTRQIAIAAQSKDQASRPMTTYIGTATSRVDGRAKVTGAAKYAGEFKVAGLAHASVVTSTIARGRITRIDASEALSVAGVIDVLTHQNRPPMASDDSAYKDEAAPEGSPFRPLYDDRIWFSGQPIALVVAEEPEIARFAASLVRVEYAEEAHVTDIHRQRDRAATVEPGSSHSAPPKPRGDAEAALAAAAVRHSAEY